MKSGIISGKIEGLLMAAYHHYDIWMLPQENWKYIHSHFSSVKPLQIYFMFNSPNIFMTVRV